MPSIRKPIDLVVLGLKILWKPVNHKQKLQVVKQITNNTNQILTEKTLKTIKLTIMQYVDRVQRM